MVIVPNVCMYCGIDENKRDIYFRAVYYPFDDEPITEGYICDDCSDDICWCDSCDREIYETDGYRRNIRWDEFNGESICVKCLQERWFDEGMEKFKDADWFMDKDLSEHGFVNHRSYFCRSDESYKKAEKDFIALQKSGNLVIVSLTASGMGLEHYFDIWIKKIPMCPMCSLTEQECDKRLKEVNNHAF